MIAPRRIAIMAKIIIPGQTAFACDRKKKKQRTAALEE